MKKLFFLFAAAAMILPLAFSCTKEDKPTNVEMEPAKTADVAKVVSFEKATGTNPTYTKDGKTFEILSIEFTEGSRYILRRRPLLTGSGAVGPWTKADDGIEVVTGTFTESNGKYNCQGEFAGTVEPKGTSADVTPQGGQTQSAPANVQDTNTTTKEATNASRTWKVNNSYIKVSGKGINIDTGFNGLDFVSIADYAMNSGISINPANFMGYSCTEVLFTGEGSMVISFSGAPSFYGTYRLSGENLSYTFLSGGNDIIGQSASGTLTFPADHKAELTLNTTIKGYTGSIQLSMSEIQ